MNNQNIPALMAQLTKPVTSRIWYYESYLTNLHLGEYMPPLEDIQS